MRVRGFAKVRKDVTYVLGGETWKWTRNAFQVAGKGLRPNKVTSLSPPAKELVNPLIPASRSPSVFLGAGTRHRRRLGIHCSHLGATEASLSHSLLCSTPVMPSS